MKYSHAVRYSCFLVRSSRKHNRGSDRAVQYERNLMIWQSQRRDGIYRIYMRVGDAFCCL